MRSSKDSLYANPLGDIAAFNFDETEADVFPDMIPRSVPGYGRIISAIGLLAGRFSRENSVCYDLGCSLGAATLVMRQQITAKDCYIIAVDNSEAMVNILIMSEELAFDDVRQQAPQDMHQLFKKA